MHEEQASTLRRKKERKRESRRRQEVVSPAPVEHDDYEEEAMDWEDEDIDWVEGITFQAQFLRLTLTLIGGIPIVSSVALDRYFSEEPQDMDDTDNTYVGDEDEEPQIGENEALEAKTEAFKTEVIKTEAATPQETTAVANSGVDDQDLYLAYVAKENESIGKIANKLEVSVRALVTLNKPRYPQLTRGACLQGGTVLLIPGTEDLDGTGAGGRELPEVSGDTRVVAEEENDEAFEEEDEDEDEDEDDEDDDEMREAREKRERERSRNRNRIRDKDRRRDSRRRQDPSEDTVRVDNRDSRRRQDSGGDTVRDRGSRRRGSRRRQDPGGETVRDRDSRRRQVPGERDRDRDRRRSRGIRPVPEVEDPISVDIELIDWDDGDEGPRGNRPRRKRHLSLRGKEAVLSGTAGALNSIPGLGKRTVAVSGHEEDDWYGQMMRERANKRRKEARDRKQRAQVQMTFVDVFFLHFVFVVQGDIVYHPAGRFMYAAPPHQVKPLYMYFRR